MQDVWDESQSLRYLNTIKIKLLWIRQWSTMNKVDIFTPFWHSSSRCAVRAEKYLDVHVGRLRVKSRKTFPYIFENVLLINNYIKRHLSRLGILRCFSIEFMIKISSYNINFILQNMYLRSFSNWYTGDTGI